MLLAKFVSITFWLNEYKTII